MKTYSFKVVVEPDDDAFIAYCPALKGLGATTWGETEQSAVRNIHEVVEMILDELIEDGAPIPEDAQVSEQPLISLTV